MAAGEQILARRIRDFDAFDIRLLQQSLGDRPGAGRIARTHAAGQQRTRSRSQMLCPLGEVGLEFLPDGRGREVVDGVRVAAMLVIRERAEHGRDQRDDGEREQQVIGFEALRHLRSWPVESPKFSE